MEAAYAPAGDRQRSVHECFSLLDFQLRFLTFLTVAAVSAEGLVAAPVRRSSGLGEWIRYLRRSAKQLVNYPSASATATAVRRAVVEILSFYDGGLPDAPPGLQNVKHLRDHISHGGPLPTDLREIDTLKDLVNAASKTIAKCIASAELRMDSDDQSRSLKRPVLIWEEHEVPLWPFFYVTVGNEWCVFSSMRGADLKYLCFGGSRGSLKPTEEQLSVAIEPFLEGKQGAKDATLTQYMKDVEKDLRGFADDDAELICLDSDQGFEFYWSKATGEGTGTQLRRDYFRLGPENARQWRAKDAWVPYSKYLRELANWHVVATRLRQRLEQIESQLVGEERETLGWISSEPGNTRMAKVVVSDMDGSNRGSPRTFAELIGEVDEDLQANRGQTQVVFINGEAGIGKTRAMVDAAKSRAQEVEGAIDQGNDTNLALFLYVRSTGQVLDSLPTVVSSAVASTRNLTDAGVKALCRNGLMTLLIDGFDELLGGAGYSDAIGSLRPWLNELGGRGVVVVSARSSYYMGQYRSSVERANEQGMELVRHRIAEVQRWSDEDVLAFLADYNVPSKRFESLSEHDRRLLGLPFFTRVFAEMATSSEVNHNSNESLTERLLNKYVEREERKLTMGQEDTTLLTSAELRRTFEYVAEFMASSAEREADISELEIAAESAIEVELNTPERRQLKQRLPVLCGLAAASDDISTSRFRFQHELFFDQFLAGAACRYLMTGQEKLFQTMLGESHWRSATVAAVVAGAGTERIRKAIGYRPRAGVRNDVAATNMGALWSMIIKNAGEIPVSDLNGLTFTDHLDLSCVRFSKLRMVDCRLSSMSLPELPGWELQLNGTKIKKIEVTGHPSDLSRLRALQHADLAELQLPNEVHYKKEAILEVLHRYGAEVVDGTPLGVGSPSEEVLAARHFLSNLARRVEKSVILRRDHQPEDDVRLKWTRVYGRDAWRKFVNGLVLAELATLDNFSASGEPKIRLRLKCSATTILANDEAQSKVQEYWKGLERSGSV
ncbi:hypothetical protein LX16_2490 [Stackebrandtia albiflava]|uniref:NACHT domain-containing protein n=2 Tax=Stackebrandtia albiflava TaxID=406432 RepID=A0A562V1T4_9ACTN|nr:hypothetical protein LX16_2490 [Stackebrandtia albiflava]